MWDGFRWIKTKPSAVAASVVAPALAVVVAAVTIGGGRTAHRAVMVVGGVGAAHRAAVVVPSLYAIGGAGMVMGGIGAVLARTAHTGAEHGLRRGGRFPALVAVGMGGIGTAR